MSKLSPDDFYKSIVSVPRSLSQESLEEYFPVITTADIDIGRIQRYFARPANFGSGEIIEIRKGFFEKIRFNRFYKAIEMTWRIAGPLDDIPGPTDTPNGPIRLATGVRTANTMALAKAEAELPGMKYKIRNVTQFYVGG